jgi:hypothetical protein
MIATLVFNTEEYRNGVKVGEHMKDITAVVLPGNNFPVAKTNTYPRPASAFNTINTHPNAVNNVQLSFIDPTISDSVFVEVIPPALTGWTFNTATTPGKGSASVAINWITPINLNPGLLPYFKFTLKVSDNECPKNIIEYDMIVRTQYYGVDSIWPGDANKDNQVDLYDPLSVALAYSEIGTPRANTDTSWQAQASTPWPKNFRLTISIYTMPTAMETV